MVTVCIASFEAIGELTLCQSRADGEMETKVFYCHGNQLPWQPTTALWIAIVRADLELRHYSWLSKIIHDLVTLFMDNFLTHNH